MYFCIMKDCLFMYICAISFCLLRSLKPGPGRCQLPAGNGQLRFFCCHGYIEKNDDCVDCPDCYTTDKCPSKFCGKGCTTECSSCEPYYVCNPTYCCICPEGMTGPYCNLSCNGGYYGPSCMKTCTCNESQICHPETGECSGDNAENYTNATESHAAQHTVEGNSGVLFIAFLVPAVLLTAFFVTLTLYLRFKTRGTDTTLDGNNAK